MIKVFASGSKGNCYLLQAEGESLLLECGIGWKKILSGLNYNLKDIKGCLITHEHKDHALSIKDIIKNSIKIYAPESVILKNNLEGSRKATILKDKDRFKIGNFNILAFANTHTNNDGTECECLGYLIQHPKLGKILFATDTYYIKYQFENIDHLLIECNYSEDVIEDLEPYQKRLFKSHMSLETLKDFFKNTDLRNTKDITLIHLSKNNADPERFKSEIEALTGIPVYIATPGLEI
ncbi:MBL fold metallo-hydrolase [Clostridium sp. K25]|uniref:MBL fold metallo-hydrolase n=1 Tax=Clostridium sp. K25 TaxID=1443109 RepID=UPI0004D46973|nr:MBL fold metallo-hydrolase [Clostridium sp. K25]KEI06193.1 metallo-beta-lactamase domain protein [Clostridium sp. K25]NFF59828.1 MBL fold metallo-hydrolase [Clostridium botulinum]NFL02399.1 MBL fold metallo-hydrolase [Clostridium botulinum]